MSAVYKKRSADSLLKAAKRMMREETVNDSASFPPSVPSDLNVKIIENKRSHEIAEYVNMSPSDFMAWWMTTTGAKRKASNIVLHYLRHKFGVNIPTDYRTLLGTPKKPIPMLISPGSYIHIGVNRALHQLLFEATELTSPTTILMQFFVDGLKIYHSSKTGLWVIMMNIRHKKLKRRLTPKVIGVYYGRNKPADFNDFLWPFVSELLVLLDEGIEVSGVAFALRILNFVLDAPARASCKCVKHINGYNGCDICLAEGEHINGRMTFLDQLMPLRNDKDYRNRRYEEYHKMESVLEVLPIDMIIAFPPDYLHCLLLGVVKWFLKYLLGTSKVLSTRDYETIKHRVQIFDATRPVEFQHKLRSFIEDLGVMKGTEFRQYVLFVAPLLLKGIISEKMIGNFLKLQIASIIFTHGRFAHYYNEADLLMKMYVQEFAEIYDPCHVTYVFHALCHMKVFIEIYGPWDNFSTFEFESYNCTIKNLLKGKVMPLTQITNRIVEVYNAPRYIPDRYSSVQIKDRQDDRTYTRLNYYDLQFDTNREGQNYVLLKSGLAVKLDSISHDRKTGKVIAIGKPFKYRSSVFDLVDTTRFNIFKSSCTFEKPISFEAQDIDGKYWKLDIPDSTQSAYYPIYVEDGKNCNNKLS